MSNIAEFRPEAAHMSLEAEQQILGALLLDDRGTTAVMRAGGAGLFSHPLHQEIYECIEDRANRGDLVSPVSIKADMAGSEALAASGGPAYLVRVAALAAPSGAVRGLAEVLAEHSRKRVLSEAIAEASAGLARGDISARDISLEIERRIISLEMRAQEDRPVSILAAVNQAVAGAMDAYHGKTEGLVKSGVMSLDEIVPGFYPGELTLLGGRPSMGKTALALTMALNVARAGHGVAIASLEMTPEAMAQRAISEGTARDRRGVPYIQMRRGDMSEDQARAMVEVAQDVARLPIVFLSRAFSHVDALVSGVRQIKRANPELGLLIVDYAQLLKAQGRDRYQQVTNISLALKGMAMSLGIPVLALSQLSRSIESRDDKRPVLSDLRESGQLEQDADSVLFCYRPEYYLRQEEPDPSEAEEHAEWRFDMAQAEGKLEIIVSKQRMGTTGTARCQCDLATNSVWG